MAHEWGRRETVIWPPHQPLWTYGAIFLALLCTAFFGWQRYHSLTVLEQSYSSEFVRSQIGSVFRQHGMYSLIYLGGGKRMPRLALPADFEPGLTRLPGGKTIPVVLSPVALAQDYRFWIRGGRRSYSDASLYRWLRGVVFERKGLLETYEYPLGEGVIVLVAALYFAVPADVRRFKEMKYGRRLRGPVMLTPKEFKREVGGRGIGFKTTEMKELMRIPMRNEAQHFQLMGDTGVGKTQLIMQILRQIQGRGDSAIVYDPACEYIQRFYDQGRGDIVLNPLDARCPYWGPASEMRSNAEADAIAASLYQPATDQKDEFFHETPAQIFAHLLKLGPTPHELAAWMASAREIESRVSGTEMEHYIGQKAGPQRSGVLSSLGLVAKSFRLLPTKEQTGDRVWSATDWAEHRRGWVFITSRPSERVTLRPLHSLWIDLLVMRLLTKPTPRQRQVWFVIDELASLQRLPQLHTAVTENRKSKNPLVLGFQGKAQLEVIYGHLAEVMLSQPATKIFMKTAEPKAAEWISAAIGKVEIERLKETKFDGSRSGKNFTLDRQVEPLVMDSEISGLTEKHAYLKLGNNVARFAFEYLDLPSRSADFVARKAQEDELIFDPKTLEKKKPTATPKPVTEAKDHAAESKPFAALPREESPAVSGAGERNQPLSTPAGMPSQPQQNAEPDPGAEAEDALADRRNREEGKAISGAGLDADHDAQDALSFEEDVAIEDERTEVENTIRMGGF